MNLPLPLLAVCLVLPPLVAQTAATTATPHVRIESVGPDGWRMRFAPTNLGSLLDSQAGRELWEPHLTPVLGMWQQLVGGEAAFPPARDRLLSYGGRVQLAVWLGKGDLGDQDVLAAALVLEGDGRTDLAALAADLQQLQQGLGGEWADTDVGDSKLRLLTQGAETMTAPIVGEHHVLCVMARTERLAGALADARALAASCTGKPPAPTTPAMRIEVALPDMVGLARTYREANPGIGDDWETAKALGVECLGPLVLTLATAGPHVQFEAAQSFPTGPSGLFAAFFPVAAAVPALQHLLPKEGSWKIGRFDLSALYAAIESVAAANGVDVVDMQKEMRDDMGVDLHDDLLAHVTDEVLFLGSPLRDVDRLEQAGWSLAFRLRDRAAFEKGLDTALANAKPALSREATIEVGDAKLHRYGNMLGYDLWFAVGGDLFVIAGGGDAEERLKSLFQTASGISPTTEAGEPTLPKALEGVRRYLPPGLHGIASGDLDSLAVVPAAWWLGMLREVAPFVDGGNDEEPDPDQPEQVRELLKKHNLDVLRTATGHAERMWRWRVFW